MQHYTATRNVHLYGKGDEEAKAVDEAIAEAFQELAEQWEQPVRVQQVIISPVVVDNNEYHIASTLFVTVVVQPASIIPLEAVQKMYAGLA